MVMTYRGGFVLVRMKVCGAFWCVKVHLLSNPLHLLLLKLLYGTSFHKYSHGSKIILFQANSNLIRHLQFESCRTGSCQFKGKKENKRFRDVRPKSISSPRRFAPRTFRPWSFRPYWTFRPLDVSPPNFNEVGGGHLCRNLCIF